MEIIVKSDYDGYFEAIAKNIVSLVRNPKYKRVIVTSGPYRQYGLTVNLMKNDPEAVNIDFYSALRTGFGRLTEQDIIETAELLEQKGE